MATLDCCDASGGRVVITANGQRWSARSAVNIMPVNFERTVGSNQDGTIHVQTKPMPAEAELTLSDRCGLMIEDIMGCPVDVTIDLIDMKRKYFFTAAVVIGRPTINSETGEIRGLKVTSNNVKATNY
jgi:hypothetical protein